MPETVRPLSRSDRRRWQEAEALACSCAAESVTSDHNTVHQCVCHWLCQCVRLSSLGVVGRFFGPGASLAYPGLAILFPHARLGRYPAALFVRTQQALAEPVAHG